MNNKDIYFLIFRLILALIIFLPLFPSRTAQAVNGRLNINLASQEQLEELPYVGEKKARAIIGYREGHGPFRHLEDLLLVDDIGRKTFEAIKSYISLSGETTALLPSSNVPGGKTHVGKKIVTTPGQIIVLADQEYYETLSSLIDQAGRSIDITMFVFKTTPAPGNKPAMLVRKLLKAAQKGVRVRLILEKSDYDDSLNRENQRIARKLRKRGIKVIFDNPKTITHAKLVVVDNHYCLVGSHNLTQSALAYNHELSLLVDSRMLAAEIVKYMDGIK